MNYKTGLIVLFSFFVFKSNAQSYEPLLNQLNEWHFTTCFSGCNTSIYYTNGDTIIGSNSFKILDGFHYISRTFLLREDITSKQVFMAKVSPTKTKVILLYDFSKQEGDTMELYNPNSPFMELPGRFQLDSIRLKPLVNGQYRHFYWSPTPDNTTSTDHPVWVEGVGSLSLINVAGGQADINGVGALSCFFKDNVSFYSNLDSISTCEPIRFLEISAQSERIPSVFPNPFSEELTISIESLELISIFDTNMNLVFEKELESGMNTLSTDFLANGIYFLKSSKSNAILRIVKF